MRYMLDTNICIYLIKNHPPQVLRRLEVLNKGEAVIPGSTVPSVKLSGTPMKSST